MQRSGGWLLRFGVAAKGVFHLLLRAGMHEACFGIDKYGARFGVNTASIPKSRRVADWGCALSCTLTMFESASAIYWVSGAVMVTLAM